MTDIALFGATGRTGSRVLQRLLARGDRVNALAREPSRLTRHPSLLTIAGDSRDPAAVGQTIAGTSAVVVTLGMQDITRPGTDFSVSVRTIVEATRAAGVRRIVAVAGAGALPDARGGTRAEHDAPGPYTHVAAEHVRNYRTLAASGLDWTLLCAVDLKDDIPEGHARLAYEDLPPGSGETGYQDLAAAIVALLPAAASYGHRIGIVSVR
jgi:putative NADH-flavin reductase